MTHEQKQRFLRTFARTFVRESAAEDAGITDAQAKACLKRKDTRAELDAMISARLAGIRCGVYHRLLSQTPAGVLGEADFFLRCLAQSPIPPLWAICQVESHHRDPACAALLSRMFRERIRGAGYTPLLYTPREDLAGTPEMAGRGLCLAAWGIPEARALAYNPLLWEYGEGALPSLPRAVLVKGYLSSLPEFGRDFSFFLRNIKRKSSSNGKKDVIFSPKRRYIP